MAQENLQTVAPERLLDGHGIRVEMRFAQVFTLRDRKQVRVQMYADPTEALDAAGVAQ